MAVRKVKAPAPADEPDLEGDDDQDVQSTADSADLDAKAAAEELDAKAGADEPVEQPSWRESLGGPYAELDDAQAVERLRNDLAQARQAHQAAQNYQYLLAQREAQLQQLVAAQQQQQTQAQQQVAPWQAPEYDPGWLNLLKRDDDGNVVSVSGADPLLPQKVRAWVDWKAQKEREFYENPYQFVWNGLYQPIQQVVAQQVNAALADYHNRVSVQDWEARHRDLLYEADGRPTSLFGKIVGLAKQLGGQNAEALDRALAQLRAEAVLAQAQQQTAGSDGAKIDFLKRNQRNPRRAGAVPKAARAQPANRVSNFYDDAMKAFEEAGFSAEDQIAY